MRKKRSSKKKRIEIYIVLIFLIVIIIALIISFFIGKQGTQGLLEEKVWPSRGGKLSITTTISSGGKTMRSTGTVIRK